MIGFILYLIVIGLVAGLLARLLVPGPDPMSLLQTWILGVIGSFVGGFLGYLLFKKDDSEGYFQASGIIGSIVGAIIVLLIYRAVNRRSGRGRVLSR
ncbi:MAG: GlsB/YeaQ/YmgE family stress response membrane protein [Acidimicrobiia bacterium]|nr:GlsB/YeaQ/YmgE family stress response membrane protein [Acidimicrobiia bacterium]